MATIKLFDMGMFVLIWIVQLIIYPGFGYYSNDQLQQWHPIYTKAITIIVLPLMLGQLVLHGWRLWSQFSILYLVVFIMVLSNWAITFFVSVPLHSKISSGENIGVSVEKLVGTNWYRTILWSLIFLSGIVK